MDKKTYGITFNGHHSTEFGLEVLDGKEITMPAKIKSLVSIPWSNNEYDFTEVVGLQSYTDRSFTIPFNIINRNEWTKENMYIKWTAVMNWLMGTTKKTPLYDDTMKQYYYMAEVRQAPDFDELRFRGILTVEFTCYPFRIAVKPEGDPMFDDIIWELDYFQNVRFDIKRQPFKSVNVGSMVNMTGWASYYSGGVPIPYKMLSNQYLVESVRDSTNSMSNKEYKLLGVTEWVLEQDILQAQTNPTEIVLKNVGSNSTIVNIKTNRKISIIKNGIAYSVLKGETKNELFKLKTGTNSIEVYTVDDDGYVEFEFYKELI